MAQVSFGVLNPPRRILMGPGPSDTHPRVLSALAAPTVGHLDPYFLQVMNETQQMLRQVFRTQNELTLAVSGTGSAGMETCVVNLVEPGDRMVVGVNGVFGGRMVDVARRAGAEVTVIERPFGEVFTVEEVAAAVRT
ncbi:MAG: alanine--glyoxylate aminotransferase family protein, partial [Planctomycetaceae bacterium]